MSALNSQVVQNIEAASTGQEILTLLKQTPTVDRDIWITALRKLNDLDYVHPNIGKVLHEIREHTKLDSESSFECLRAMTKAKRFRDGNILIDDIYNQGVQMTPELGEAYIRFYCEHDPHQAIAFFDSLSAKTEKGYMFVIKACTKAGLYERGLKYFQQIPKDGLEYNKYTFSSAFNCVSKLRDIEIANKIFYMWKIWCEKQGIDYRHEPYMIGILMHLYYSTSDLHKGATLFNEIVNVDWMRDSEQNHVIFNFFLSLLEKCGQSKYADALLAQWDTDRFFNFDIVWGDTEFEAASLYQHKIRVVRLTPLAAQAIIRFGLHKWKDEGIEEPVAIVTGAGMLRDQMKETLEKLDPPLLVHSWLENRRKREIGFTLTPESIKQFIDRKYEVISMN